MLQITYSIRKSFWASCWSNKMPIDKRNILKKFHKLILLGILLVVAGCGRAYFPIELKTISRSDRIKGQEVTDIELISMTRMEVVKANKTEYIRRVIKAGDLTKPASIVSATDALKEKLPANNDPGPYTLGKSDIITITTIIESETSTRTVEVSDNGFVNLIDIGRVKAEGMTHSELEEQIIRTFIESGQRIGFEFNITGFRSKQVYINGDSIGAVVMPYTNKPLYLEDAITLAQIKKINGQDSKITLIREGEKYIFSLVNVLENPVSRYRLFPGDRIFVEGLNYRPEFVLVVGETGAQRSISISAFQRHTLSDTIFNGNVLNNVTSDFSQIYVIREKNKKFLAYHLDITNPARIKIANEFEMRPDDIIFVAAQPLSLYSRTLSQLLGSTGLTLQARDTIRTELNN